MRKKITVHYVNEDCAVHCALVQVSLNVTGD